MRLPDDHLVGIRHREVFRQRPSGRRTPLYQATALFQDEKALENQPDNG